MRRLVLALAIGAGLLAAPATASPPAAPTAVDCGPTTATARHLAAQSTSVERLSPTRARYHLNMVPVASAGGATAFTSAPAATLQYFHEDLLHHQQSPYTELINGRKYRYLVDLWIDHEWSDPCSEPDRYGFGTETFAERYNPVTGARDLSTPANFDIYAALQWLSGGTWVAPWGYKHFHATRRQGPCFAGGNPHDIVDGSAWIRTWIWIDMTFWLYPTFNDPYYAQARKTSTRSLLAGSPTHQNADNSGWPEFHDGGAHPDAGSTVYQCN